MATALHAQTQMTFKFGDEILPRAYGFPMKIRVPTKLGFKNPKYVMSMEVTNDYKGGFSEDQGYNSFSGCRSAPSSSPLRPQVPIPRVLPFEEGWSARLRNRKSLRCWFAATTGLMTRDETAGQD